MMGSSRYFFCEPAGLNQSSLKAFLFSNDMQRSDCSCLKTFFGERANKKTSDTEQNFPLANSETLALVWAANNSYLDQTMESCKDGMPWRWQWHLPPLRKGPLYNGFLSTTGVNMMIILHVSRTFHLMHSQQQYNSRKQPLIHRAYRL